MNQIQQETVHEKIDQLDQKIQLFNEQAERLGEDGKIEEVPFTSQEPEYTYDTGFADDPFVQEAEKKLKQQQPESPQPSNDQRWWLIRVVVLIILLVVGRKVQLSALSRKTIARRRRTSR